MHRARNAFEEGLGRIVQANYLYAVADFDIGFYKLTKSLWRAAGRRGETTDDVKYMQKDRDTSGEFKTKINGKSTTVEYLG
jgi:hypothetical protein